MSHTELKLALAHGTGLLNAWATGELNKIDYARRHAVASDATVAALTTDVAIFDENVAKFPHKFFGQHLILRNIHGKNLRLDGKKHEHAKGEHHGAAAGHDHAGSESDHWTFEDAKLGDGTFYLHNDTDRHISPSMDHVSVTIASSRAARQPHEQLTLVETAPGKYALQTRSQHYIAMDEHDRIHQHAGPQVWDITFAHGGADATARKAHLVGRLASARAAAEVTASANDAQLKANLQAELGRRVTAKQELYTRIAAELAILAS